MRLGNMIESLTILQKYYKDGNGHHLQAEHEFLFAYPTDKPVSDKDFQRLRTLGWSQQTEDGDYKYDISKTWSCYI